MCNLNVLGMCLTGNQTCNLLVHRTILTQLSHKYVSFTKMFPTISTILRNYTFIENTLLIFATHSYQHNLINTSILLTCDLPLHHHLVPKFHLCSLSEPGALGVFLPMNLKGLHLTFLMLLVSTMVTEPSEPQFPCLYGEKVYHGLQIQSSFI